MAVGEYATSETNDTALLIVLTHCCLGVIEKVQGTGVETTMLCFVRKSQLLTLYPRQV